MKILAAMMSLLLLAGCATQTPIDELPMYGALPLYGNRQQTDAIKAANAKLIVAADAQPGGREYAGMNTARSGWQYFGAGDASMAMRRFNQAWALDDSNPSPYWGFCTVLDERRDYDGAILMGEKALELAPDNARLLADVALAYLSRGWTNRKRSDPTDDYAKAQDCLERAMKADPSEPVPYFRRAILAYYRGDAEKATTWIGEARKRGLGPDNPRWDSRFVQKVEQAADRALTD